MLIHWFTVLAQIVNFLVLVGLLKRFLWGKLVQAMDQREARIAAELAQAEDKRRAAQQQLEQVQAVAAEQERKCGEMILQARKEAEEQRTRMIARSRQGVREMEAQWQEDLERERAIFFKELRKRAATQILAVARQALADLACSDLQCSAVTVFLEKLQSLDAVSLRQMGNDNLIVRSPADLPKETQDEIQSILAGHMDVPAHLQFVRDPSLAWGIELRGNGVKIGWSPESYLDAIEERLKTELDRPPAREFQMVGG